MKSFFILISIIFLLPLAFSLVVKVDVKGICQIELRSFDINYEEVPYLKTELYNSGSLPLKTRVFIDTSAKYWSKEILLNPGEIINLKFPFVPSEKNRIKIFYCSNLLEKEFDGVFSRDENLRESDDLRVVGIRSYGSYLVFDVVSNISTNLYVLPSEYPESWIVEYSESFVKKGRNTIKINFIPLGNEEIDIGFYLLSSNGAYRYQKVRIEKPIGLKFFFYFIFDHFRLWVKNFF